ncbi:MULTISPECIES: YnbE family lipoprotein [Sphingomonas]|uniref:YnbE family lipoprotein n=1 Tax=Sphingomonas cavernae TaxID=2320861 RepID=A0A418W812_9SPHN|nr:MULTISPECIES: YnbE family lipoprotein [Sphingomonas]MCJ8159864.1 YnbE family lipoprotein [Sphingomonas sp. LaA6.9]RJF86136.1 YnbE family lipoprotein [Sphingomonas cavernae]
MLALLGLSAILGGCIQVKAPDKPIEINLNVNVRQEVVVRLQQDAQQLIQENPELFPQ